jgi:hypothetical protein
MREADAAGVLLNVADEPRLCELRALLRAEGAGVAAIRGRLLDDMDLRLPRI